MAQQDRFYFEINYDTKAPVTASVFERGKPNRIAVAADVSEAARIVSALNAYIGNHVDMRA